MTWDSATIDFLDMMQQSKRRLMEWEKIFANHISEKRLISRICKELLKLNNKNTIQ